MQELRKQQTKTATLHKHESQQRQEKQNSPFERYQQKLADKQIQRATLQRAQKIAMNQKLKEIVSDNVRYFRNIIEAKELHKPNQFSLKLPAKVISSLYRTEFLKKKLYGSQNLSVDMKKSFFDRSKNFSQTKLPLTTTYQNEFKKISEIEIKKNHRSKELREIFDKKSVRGNTPTFLDTQNNLQYKNWGTGAVMPSMKPTIQVATTDIPFKATSMYRSNFSGITLPKTKIVNHQESFPHSIDLWMGNSSYNNDFNKKQTRMPQKGYKPLQSSGATNLPFKSTTEYKQQFIEQNSQKNKKMKYQWKKLTDQDIEKLVMDL